MDLMTNIMSIVGQTEKDLATAWGNIDKITANV